MEGLIIILALGLILAIVKLISWVTDLQSDSKKYWANKKKIDDLDYNTKKFEEYKKETLESYKVEKANIEKIVRQKSMQFPWLAGAFSDYYALIDGKKEYYLEHKSHPAKTAADVVREIKQEKKILQKTNKLLSYKIDYYENLFPWLTDIIAEDEDDDVLSINNEHAEEDDNGNDKVKDFLTPEEYKKLPSVTKNQLALDRYLQNRRKSRWQIGRDYEMYVGYICEQKGYQVEYKGIIDGYEDMGRDIIARKKGEVRIIQCKYWSQKKEIHEKHIFQLFGTTMEYWLTDMGNNKESSSFEDFARILSENKIHPIFFTSTKLSEKAKRVATSLNVQVIENHPIGNFPRIKCNISNNGEKIYHLPFDQQYDRTVIDVKSGESYQFTVQEAEDAGFRRAFKHNF